MFHIAEFCGHLMIPFPIQISTSLAKNLTNEAGKLDRLHPLAKGKTSYTQKMYSTLRPGMTHTGLYKATGWGVMHILLEEYNQKQHTSAEMSLGAHVQCFQEYCTKKFFL